MRGLRSFAYGMLAVLLAIALSQAGFSPAAIVALISVSLLGDMAGTYVVGLFADSWGRRRTLALLSLLMAATGVVFGRVSSYPVLLLAAFFEMLGTSASEIAPFLPIDQAMIAQVTTPERRTALFALLSAALGALLAGLPALLMGVGLSQTSGIRLLFVAYAVLGLVVALFFHLRFGVPLAALATLFFGANLLLALSSLSAVPLARHFGLFNTMVFTHLPSNVLLTLVAFAPTFPIAAGLLLLRQTLLQMDVPTRQAYTMALVEPEERTATASVTSLVRSVGSSSSPMFSGLLLQGPLLVLGLPFILAGALKAGYDLTLWSIFRQVHVPEEEEGSSSGVQGQAEPATHPVSQEAGMPPADGRRTNP